MWCRNRFLNSVLFQNAVSTEAFLLINTFWYEEGIFHNFEGVGLTKSEEVWLRQLLSSKSKDRNLGERTGKDCFRSALLARHCPEVSTQQKYTLKKREQSLSRAAKSWDSEVKQHKHAKCRVKQSQTACGSSSQETWNAGSGCQQLAWGERTGTWKSETERRLWPKQREAEQPH